MADQPSTSDGWREQYSKRDQEWISDRFSTLDGLDSFVGEGLPNVLEYGFNYADLEAAYDDAKTGAMAVDNFVKIGNKHLATARDKEEKGFTQSAFEYYLRATQCFTRASWAILDAEDEYKLYQHGRALDAYDKVIELNPHYEMAKVNVELPFHEERLPAVFHEAGGENAPTILHLPGMDMTKEQTPNHINNRFVQRGMNVLTIDGPGQGEARLRGITDDDHTVYQRAGSAAIDWLVERDEVDPERIGVYGTSMGSYFGPRVAVEDDRVAALALIKGTWYTKDIIFEQSPPSFKKRYMYMSGITDEAEFDAFAREMTLEGMESEIDVPTFIGHGEYDGLTPREQAIEFFEGLAGPKRLQLYENAFHGIGDADVICDVVDWFEAVWRGDIDDEYEEAVYVPEYPNHSYVPSPKFDFVSQPDEPEGT